MTNCEQIWDDLKAYSDGELPIMARLRVRRHLSHCPACREEIETMELIRRRLRQPDATVFTPELKDKILAGIPEGVPHTDETLPTRNKKKPMLIFGATAAAALSWFLFYPMLQNGLSPRSTESKAIQMAPGSSAPMAAGTEMDMAKSAANAPAPISAGEEIKINESVSNVKQLGTPYRMYVQDYDEASTVAGDEGRKETKLAKRNALAASAPALNWRIEEKPVAPNASASFVAIERQVHRDASLTVQVDSAEAKSEKVETMLKAEGGYVADSNLSTLDDGTKSATMTLKVPVDKFESFMATLSKLGEVKAKSVSGEDLTERIIDEKQGKRVLGEEIEETQNRLRQRKLSKLQEKEDRETLRELKTRIAIKQARLDLYKKMATLSNISLTLSEKPKKPQPSPAPQSGFMSELKETASTAGQAFMQAAKLPFILLIWIAVYSPVWLILLAGYRYFVVRA